jgi:uncharacterized membrane protein
MPTSLIIFFITGLLFSGMAIPLIRKRVKINSWYGIRVPDATISDEVWYEVNAIMGRYLFAFGLVISVLSLHFILNPSNEEYKMVYTLIGVLIFGTILFVKLSFSTTERVKNKHYK